MKRFIIISAVALSAFSQTNAQTAHKQHLLTVSMYEDRKKTIMIITREDGKQDEKQLNFVYPSSDKKRAAYEDSLMGALKPFFADGWQLAATNKSGSIANVNGEEINQTTRYFFTKRDE